MPTYEIRVYTYPEHDQATICTSEIVANQAIGFGPPIITTMGKVALVTAVNQATARIIHKNRDHRHEED